MKKTAVIAIVNVVTLLVCFTIIKLDGNSSLYAIFGSVFIWAIQYHAGKTAGIYYANESISELQSDLESQVQTNKELLDAIRRLQDNQKELIAILDSHRAGRATHYKN